MPFVTHSKLHAKSQIVSITIKRLCNHGGSSSGLVSPGWWKDTDGLVVAGETVDTGLNENETELGVLVLAVTLEVLTDSDSLEI